MTLEDKIDLVINQQAKHEESFEALRSLTIGMSRHMMESFARIDSNFEALETRLNELEGKLDILSHDTGKDFTTVKGELDSIKHEIRKIEKVSPYNEQYENLLKIAR